ncbi:MAG TPA: hypothetical protein DCE71_06070 [Parachlamydiales bacterium]|nr:hypothetical protein [Parachlamydiales bacterium]
MILFKSFPADFLAPHRLFWKENPALLLAISFLLGTSSYLYSLNPLFPLVWLIYLFLTSSFFQGVSFALLGWGYAFFLYQGAPRAATPTFVQGIFSVSSLQPHHSPFHKGFLYKGTLLIPEAVSCSICLQGDDRPPADQDYWVEGLLSERSPFSYSLKIKTWKPLSSKQTIGSWRFAEMRYRAKEAFRFLLKKTTSPQTACLLGSLLTGDVEERLLRYEFGRAGLQHLLSVSGFHFALLIAFFSASLGLFFPERTKNILLLLVVTLYFLFIGPAPAVLRSFFAATLYLIGKLLNRRPAALNLLGCCMLFELIFDPLLSGHIGFQLSFLSCAGLLLVYPQLHRFSNRFLPQRTVPELADMTLPSPYGYLISSFFKKTLCMTLAVNIALLPLLFYHFHKFPLLGLIYNLFFPLGAALSIYLLLPSLLIYSICPLLGAPLLSLADVWTRQLLELISYPPLLLDKAWQQADLPSWACGLYLFLLFFFLIQKKQ